MFSPCARHGHGVRSVWALTPKSPIFAHFALTQLHVTVQYSATSIPYGCFRIHLLPPLPHAPDFSSMSRMLNTPLSPSYLVDRLSLLCGLSMWKLVTSGPLTPLPRRSHVAQMISAFHCLAPCIFRQSLHQSGCKPLISRHFASADRRTYHRICRRDVILVRRCSCSRSGFAPSILPLLFTLICLV